MHESPDSLPAMRRWLHASLEAQTDHITAEIRALVPPQPGAAPSGWLAGVAAVVCAAALVAAGFWWGDHSRLQADRAELMLLRQSIAARPAAAPAAAARAGGERPCHAGLAAAAPQPLVLEVPYGADALGGSRLERHQADAGPPGGG